MNIPLLADKTGEISKAYGVYKEDEGNKIKFCDVGKSYVLHTIILLVDDVTSFQLHKRVHRFSS